MHTPEGVRDIYGEEYARRMVLERKLHEKLHLYGYHDLKTPTFEFFDVFSKEVGTTPSKELYKFFDKEGNTLVLRPDFTPSMARCAAKYFCDEKLPIRFCYDGNTFINRSNLQGKLKEVTQMGVEYIGDDSVAADAEMISLLVESLKNVGLSQFQVSIGEVEYFKGLCEAAGLDQDTENSLREYISNKNYFAVDNLLTQANVSEEYREVLLELTDLFGNTECLSKAKKLVNNERSLKAVERLEQLEELLKVYGVNSYVSYDFGMLSKYNYYTGVIFKAYTYGVGDAIAKGGRYDELLSQFGKSAAAIGFAIIVDDLMNAVLRQNIEISLEGNSTCLLYQKEQFDKAIAVAGFLRKNNMPTELILIADEDMKKYTAYAKDQMHTQLMCISKEKDVKVIELSTGTEKSVPLAELGVK